jgi:peptidoglycan/LPS O-acetylase OafA/YrhL
MDKSSLVLSFKKEHLSAPGSGDVAESENTPTATSPAGGRVHALDGLRGILAVVVVADHTAVELGSAALGAAASVSVAVFFILSGLVLTRAWDGHFGRFLARRFLRLWPVFGCCFIAGSLLAGLSPITPELLWVPWPVYDANIRCPPTWSLFIEAWSAFAMPFFVWSSRGGLFRSLGAMAACVAVAVAWWPHNLAFRAFLCYLVCFVIGAALSRKTLRNGFLESPAPQFLGRISYSLYLSHWLVLRGATAAWGMAGTILAIPAVFAVAWLTWRVVERPSIALSRRIGAARAAPA